MSLAPSELVLNPDHSVYHLGLHPEDIADTILLVGDPGRVRLVSDKFEKVTLRQQKREFITHTGELNGKRLTVMATGIGTDNIDIVLNELDALVNIDLKRREFLDQKTSLRLVRMGTSGSLQSDIPVDSILLSEAALGFDGLMHFYDALHVMDHDFSKAFRKELNWPEAAAHPYLVRADHETLDLLKGSNTHVGVTITAHGFYGPQGRELRIPIALPDLNDRLESFRFGEERITNYEMETSALYGLGKMMGHRCTTACVIIANRPNNDFSANYHASVEQMIDHVLERLTAQ